MRSCFCCSGLFVLCVLWFAFRLLCLFLIVIWWLFMLSYFLALFFCCFVCLQMILLDWFCDCHNVVGFNLTFVTDSFL